MLPIQWYIQSCDKPSFMKVWSLRGIKVGITPVSWDDSAFPTTGAICVSERWKMVESAYLLWTKNHRYPNSSTRPHIHNGKKRKSSAPIFYIKFTILNNELSEKIFIRSPWCFRKCWKKRENKKFNHDWWSSSHKLSKSIMVHLSYSALLTVFFLCIWPVSHQVLITLR